MPDLKTLLYSALAVLTLVLSPVSSSVAQDTLSGEVLIDSQDEAIVSKALGQILARILSQSARDAEAARSDAAREAIGKSRDYVQSYTFRQELAMVGGVPTRQLYLNASFDRRTIQSLLNQGGVNAVPTNAANGEVRMLIYGLQGSADYARVISYLGQLPVVRKVQVDAANRDQLALRANVSGAGDALIASVTDGGVLTWITVGSEGRLEFELQ